MRTYTSIGTSKKLVKLPGSGFVITVAAIVGLAGPPAMAQRASDMQSLKDQMKTLQKKIEKMEKDAGTKAGPIKGSFLVPGTNTYIRFGGFVQADMMVDFAGDPGDLYSTSSIPLQDASSTARSNESTRIVGRNSRLNFTSLIPIENGHVKGYLEMDFRGARGTETISNSHRPRLRHAFTEFPISDTAKLTFGQTWSNAFSFGTSASSVSWVGSEGGLFVRNPQIRYTQKLGKAMGISLSVENPETRVGGAPAGTGPSGTALNDLYPDILGKVTAGGKWGRADIGIVNQFPRIDRGGVDETAYAWGLWANAGIKVTSKDTIYVQTSYGRGMGRYLNASFQSGYVVGGKIKLSEQYGIRLGYGHKFGENLSFNIFGGLERNDSPSGFTGNPNSRLRSAHANVFYRPFPKKARNLWMALEYVHGERETESGQKGEADRIHFATRYNF